MKTRRLSIARLSFALASAIAALLATQSAHATIYYWDGNDGTAGFGTAAGTWAAPTTGTATSGWSTDATGATVVLSNSVTTATADTLNFGTAATGLAAGTITVSGTVDAGDITFASASGAIVLSGGTINLAAAETITVNNASDTISSILSGAGTSFTKAGSGTLTLNGSAVNTFTGSLNVNGGTLLLDFANLATPTNLINSGNALSLSGGTLSIKGKSTGTTSQTLGNVTVNAGGGQILGDKNGGTSTTIALGTITATATGGSLLLGASGTNANLPVITTTSSNDATGILGGRIVYFNGTANTGYDFATGGTVGAYASYTAMPLTGGSSSDNDSTAAGGTLSGPVAANTLKIVGSATALALGANLMTINSGGLLSTGTTAQTISGTAGGTTLTAGNGSGSYDLIVHQYISGGLTISAVIGNNGGNAVSLVKSGTRTLSLTGTNTFTGDIIINAGRLGTGESFSVGASAYGSGSNITFAGTGTLEAPNTSAGSTLNKSLTVNDGVTGTLSFASAAFSATFTGQLIGNGTLVLTTSNGAAAFTNPLNTFTGTLRLNTAAAVTVNSLADSANPIQFLGNESFNLNSTGTVTSLLFNSRRIELAGTTLGGQVANNAAAATITINTDLLVTGVGNKALTLAGTGAALSTFAGKITDGPGSVIGLTKSGTGTWTLSNTGNSYTGTTTVSAGTLQLGVSNVLPDAGAVSVTGGTLQLSTFSDTVGVVNISGGTIDGTTAVLSGSRVVATGTSTISAILGGSGSLSRAIAGSTTSLTKANTYSGGTTVVGGTLAVGASGTLGQNVVGNGISISEQGILTLAAAANSGSNQTITFASSSSSDGRSGNLAVLGLGFNGLPTGAIAQANTAGGVIAINAVTGYNTDLSSTLTGKNLFLGAIGTSTFTGAAGTVAAGNGSLYRLGGGGGTITFNTTNLFTGANGLQIGSSLVNGGGTVVISAAQDYSGATTLSAGTLTLSGAGGTATGTSSFTLNGNKLFLDNTGTNNADRIGTVAVSLSTGGELSLSGNASGTTETIGNLSIGAGSTTVTVKATTASSTLAAGAFSRSDNGTALFRGTSLGQNVTPMGRVTLTGTGGLTFVGASTLANAATGDTTKDVRIIPYLVGDTTDTGNGTTFVTYDTTLGFRALSTANQFNTTVTAGTNVRFVTTAQTGITTNSINSLIVAVAGNTIADANTLTVTSGALLFSATGSIAPAGTTGVLDFGGAQGVITTPSGITGTISAKITGSAGIIKSGTGTLLLPGTNTFTGGLILNGGTIGENSVNALTALSLNNNAITVNGSATIFAVAGNTFSSSSTITLNAGTLGITNNNGFTTWNGAVTGVGNIALSQSGLGANTLNLNSTANTFTGRVDYTSGLLATLNVNSFVDSASPGQGNIRFSVNGAGQDQTFALGSGALVPLTITNRQFELTNSVTYNAIIKNNSSQAFTINSNLFASGTGTKTLQLGGTGTGLNTFAGTLTNGTLTALSITKADAGTWTLSGSNTYTGATTITTGILDFANKAAKTTATATAAAAGSVGLGVKASDAAYYSATDVGNLFNTNTLAGFSLNAASGVAIDTTNAGADFDQTVALTAGRALTKLGTGTLKLSGTNTYGLTTITTGIVDFANKAAKPAGTATAGAAGSVGLGVKASDAAYYSATDVGNLFNTTLSGFSLNAASGVAIDTTNAGADFDQTVALTAGRALTKLGTGTLKLSGTNTYSGITTVSAGSLALGANNVLPDASAISIGTATLNASTFTDTVGTLDTTGTAVINLGTGGALAFAASNGVDWTGGTLNVTGTLGATSLRFGTSSSGLTSTQLALISVNGSGAGTYTLDSSGYLVAAGPGPVDHFVISAISGTKTVGTAITGITLTAQDASNATATSFTGTVTFGGTAGITGTSASFTAGVLNGVSVTPSVVGAGRTFTVDDGAGHTGSATFTVQSLYDAWATANGATGGAAGNPDGDTLTNLQEYAFGTNPTVSTGVIEYASGVVTQNGVPKIVSASGTYYMAFGRRADYVAAGLTYTVQFSAGLDTWVDNDDIANPPVQVATDGTINALEVPYVDFVTTPSGTQKPTFSRVKVVQAP